MVVFGTVFPSLHCLIVVWADMPLHQANQHNEVNQVLQWTSFPEVSAT